MSTTAIDNTEIKFDRITKDFAILVDGVAVAYGRNYSDAEAKRTAYLADRDGDDDDAPDLIAEAAILRNAIEEMRYDLEADYQAEGCLPLAMMQYHTRLGRIIAKAERRLQRREFAELGGIDYDTKQYQPTGWCYVCGSAAWVWDTSGPLCPDHHGILQEMTVPNDPELSIEAIAAHMASVHIPNWQPASIDDADLPF